MQNSNQQPVNQNQTHLTYLGIMLVVLGFVAVVIFMKNESLKGDDVNTNITTAAPQTRQTPAKTDPRLKYPTNYHLIIFSNTTDRKTLTSIEIRTEPTILDMDDINLQIQMLKKHKTLPQNFRGHIIDERFNPDSAPIGSAERVYFIQQLDPNAPNAQKPEVINIGIPEGTLPGN